MDTHLPRHVPYCVLPELGQLGILHCPPASRGSVGEHGCRAPAEATLSICVHTAKYRVPPWVSGYGMRSSLSTLPWPWGSIPDCSIAALLHHELTPRQRLMITSTASANFPAEPQMLHHCYAQYLREEWAGIAHTHPCRNAAARVAWRVQPRRSRSGSGKLIHIWIPQSHGIGGSMLLTSCQDNTAGEGRHQSHSKCQWCQCATLSHPH